MKKKRHAAGLAVVTKTSGQTLIETCIVVSVISLVFLGLFQVSQIFAAREVLHHSAARGSRAKTVGFNRFMVSKCMRVAVIPNSGRMINPDYAGTTPLTGWLTLSPGELWDRVLNSTPSSGQYDIERVRIPEYLGSENEPRARVTLDYENWDTITMSQQSTLSTAEAYIRQDYPLWVPLHETFYNADSIALSAQSTIENHCLLYLDDEGR